jgi:hypothetical protein
MRFSLRYTMLIDDSTRQKVHHLGMRPAIGISGGVHTPNVVVRMAASLEVGEGHGTVDVG